MFKLTKKYEVNRSILKCDYIRSTPSEISSINTSDSQIYINIPREDSVISLLNGYLDLNFDIVHAATNNRYTDGTDIRLINLGAIALFCDYKLTESSGKHLEDISLAHIVSLMCKLITSAKDTDDLSIGFDRDRGRRQRELTNNNIKGKYHLRIMLKHVFAFAQHQNKASFGLCYKLTLTRNSVNSVLNQDNKISNAEIKINALEWYVPHYTPSIPHQAILCRQILSKTPTELQYVERSVFMKEVNTQNLWTFELGSQEGINVPIWFMVGFQQRDRQEAQNLNNDTFYRRLVTSAHCIIGTEKYPDSAILLNYDDYDYSQRYGPIEEAFRALTKDDILKPCISDNFFRSSNNGYDIGYNLYVFDKGYQKNQENAQPIEVEFKFSENVTAGIYGYALVLTNKLVSISSYGQRHFDPI